MKTSAVFRVNGVRVGVIGSTVRNTPELVRASATAGLEFLDEAERIRRESAKLRAQGVNVQVVVIHEGADRRREPDRRRRRLRRGRARSWASSASSRTRPSTS